MRFEVPAAFHRCETEVKRSRFIASAAWTPDETEHLSFLSRIRSEFPDANHNCWGAIFGPPEQALARCSDDGEPQGAAGVPILNVLQHSGIQQISLVVSRYFGGIRLGRGGMARAYSGAARELLCHIPRRQQVPRTPLAVTVPYNRLELLLRLLADYETACTERNFAADVTCLLDPPDDRRQELICTLQDQLQGELLLG